ncbi:MAG TPA: LuxR C-terminal-related transcriptional regulator, partial [Thermomicrobiales bacterium]|nr:LuxR C-terminal-related transcriptional regulator [Thermomicrobiales bacterium]
DNLRAALEWALTSGDPDIALRLAAAIWRFWFVRGHATEGRAWLDRCLARERAAASPALAEALYAAASLAFDQIDLAPAIAFSERAENAFHHAGDTLAAIRAREVRALAIWEAGDRDQGDALLAETLAAFRASDAPAEVAACLNEIGINFSNRGQLDRAASMWEEAAAIHRGLGVTLDTGVVLGNLALVAADRGDSAAALALRRESLAIFAEQNSLRAIFGALEEMAALAGHWGDQDTAARLLGAADGLRRAIGIPIAPSYRAEYDQIVASVRGGMDEARFAASWANGRSLPLADALALADAVTVPPAPPRREPAPHGLSPREAEVVRLIVDGRSNQEIANALFISHRTASTHVRNILTKLDLDSRTAVAAWAIRRGLA